MFSVVEVSGYSRTVYDEQVRFVDGRWMGCYDGGDVKHRSATTICQYRNREGRAVAIVRRTQAVSWFVPTRPGAVHGETVRCHDGELSPTCSFKTRDQTRFPC